MENTTYKILVAFGILLLTNPSSQARSSEMQWGELTSATFEQAQSEGKIILLNLKANWCHWCHVMHDSTYSSEQVQTYIDEYFIPVEADQDANPELSARYKKFGWPATIFINAKGEDIVKRAGYIAPNNFLRLLKAIVKDPSPEKNIISLNSIQQSDDEKLKSLQILERRFYEILDYKKGGFDQAQKYVDYDAYEYGLYYVKFPKVNEWVKLSEEKAIELTDPIWGGVYQYSTHYGWDYPHFEKLLDKQARYLGIFTNAFVFNNDQKFIKAANEIASYADRFLWQEGLYANSQDADLVQGEHSEEYFALDDEERLEQGIPNIDSNTYTFNNASYAKSLLNYSFVINYPTIKNRALEIADNLLKRANSEGLYYHSDSKRNLISMKDNVAMAELLTHLVKLEPQEKYISSLRRLLDALISDFRLDNGSFVSYVGNLGLEPQPVVTENIRLARILNWYSYYSKDGEYKFIAKNIFNFLVSPNTLETFYLESNLLSLAIELETEPYSIAYYKPIGNSNYLHKSKSILPFYSLVDDFTDENVPKSKQGYFEGFDEDVILICTSTFCSSPIYLDEGIIDFFKEKNGLE